MPAFVPIPLGQRIPASLHAVSCSLPTMRAVRGYEEKDPEIVRAMTSGYPRFVVHPFLQQLASHVAQTRGLDGHTLWAASSERMARRLAEHLGAAHATLLSDGDIHFVAHPAATELASRAKTFLQHTGGFLSSRAAEDRLAQLGLVRPTPELRFAGDALAEVRRHLAPLFTGVPTDQLFLTNCGMSAVDAAFRAVAELQASRGRTIWVQLGWLYLDTIALLKKFTASPVDYVHVRDVFDLAALERLFAERGDRIAGLVAEAPTNPLVQMPDLPGLAALVHRHGARLILDPSITSSHNIDVLPHADVVVSSLTKYAASEGDLTAGLVVVNPAGSDAAILLRHLSAKIEPLYARDLARLAAQIGTAPQVLARINANVQHVVDFLRSHPNVKEIHWALAPASRANYLRVARTPESVGCMITFTLHLPLERFYDRVRLPKGPSFGMKTSLLCPFMYLAHYDLVTTPTGRAELQASGLDPDLLRLAVGAEPIEDILAALAEALA
ncbi:MAG TPA: PLP-dependent transferase [Opitutus sp.]|nr:PLP-dependent transferase [Opitutus sp.]